MARIKHPVARKRKIASASSPGFGATPRTRTSPRKRAASPQATNTTGRKKARRFRPGTVALREIRRLQKSVNLLIPAAPFIRTVREISGNLAPEISRWTAEALLAIQEAAEDFLVHLFEDAMLCAFHAKRVTISKRNLCIVASSRGEILRHLNPMSKVGAVNVHCLGEYRTVKKDFELARRLGGKGQPW